MTEETENNWFYTLNSIDWIFYFNLIHYLPIIILEKKFSQLSMINTLQKKNND
jgi:hypothetical protein